MNVNQLAKVIAEKEGKKTQVSIAQVKEVLSVAAEIFAFDKEAAHAFVEYVERKGRASRKATANATKSRAKDVETRVHKRLKR